MSNSTQPTELQNAWKEQRGSFIFVGGFSFVMNLMMLAPTLYMLQVYDRVMASRSEATLLFLTLIVGWMFVVMGVLEIVRSRIMVRVAARLDERLHKSLYAAMQEFTLKNPGKAAPNVISDLASLRQFLAGNGPFAFFDAPWVPVYIFVMTMFHWTYGIFAIFTATILTVLAVVNNFSTDKAQADAGKAQAIAASEANAQSRNSEVVHAMGMVPALQKRWSAHFEKASVGHRRTADKQATWSNISKTMRLAFQSLILGLGALLVINGEISGGMVMAGSFLLGRALAPLDQMIATWRQFKSARNAMDRINELFASQTEKDSPMSLPAPEGRMTVKRLIVTPPNMKTPSLKGLEFEIPAGETVVVIGNSGAGKSSLVRALLGIWNTTSGEVRLDGTELKHWNRNELGHHVGYLPQDVELFDGTIAENIARFTEAEPNDIVAAARLAGVDEMIRTLPEGYDTRIGVGGATLSGGQRQRIGLARAVFGDPKLIVLDEPNANLDVQGESALRDACLRLKERGVTLIIVSHRPNITSVADKLLVLENGMQKLYGPAAAVSKKLAEDTMKNNQAKVLRKPGNAA